MEWPIIRDDDDVAKKTSTVLEKTRPNTWGDNTMGNNEWKETSGFLTLPLAFFLAAFCFSLSRHHECSGGCRRVKG